MSELRNIINVWKAYLESVNDWRELIDGAKAKSGGCGQIYELPNPIYRPAESFAIADMRNIELMEPHKHVNNETEIYFCIEGSGKAVIGDSLEELKPGKIVIIPPNTLHIVSVHSGLVIAAINTPPFNPGNVVNLSMDAPEVLLALDKLKS